jgi:hypothetical protein
MAAYSLHHEQSPLGNYLRRMKSKLGPAGATLQGPWIRPIYLNQRLLTAEDSYFCQEFLGRGGGGSG